MANEKETNKEYQYIAPSVAFDNQLDYVAAIRFKAATPTEEGVKAQIVIKGFDMNKLSDSAEWSAFVEFAKSKGTDPQGILKEALAHFSTRPKYPIEKTDTPETFAARAQKNADDYRLGERAKSDGKVKVTPTVAKAGAAVQAQADALGLSLEEFMAMVAKVAARKTK